MRTLIIVALMSLLSVQIVRASNCEQRSVEQIFAQADAIFTGIVERDTRVRVTEAFKGVLVGERVPTRGGFAGTVGQRMTYAAYRQDDGVVRIITGPHSRACYCESFILERNVIILRKMARH